MVSAREGQKKRKKVKRFYWMRIFIISFKRRYSCCKISYFVARGQAKATETIDLEKK